MSFKEVIFLFIGLCDFLEAPKPVAITVTMRSLEALSSITFPQTIIASLEAKFFIDSCTASSSPKVISGPEVMFTNTPLASCKLISSSNLLETACSEACLALSGPDPVPVPIMAVPFSDITVLTSAKSTLIIPGCIIMSDIPLTAPERTSLACLNASNMLQS